MHDFYVGSGTGEVELGRWNRDGGGRVCFEREGRGGRQRGRAADDENQTLHHSVQLSPCGADMKTRLFILPVSPVDASTGKSFWSGW